MICGYFRGRLSIVDCIDLPIRTLNTLYYMSWKKSKADAEKAKQEEETNKLNQKFGGKNPLPNVNFVDLIEEMEEGGIG